MTSEEIMLQIKDTLVSLDLAEQFFLCDLDSCLGECCIEGDAGAPITKEEYNKIKEILIESAHKTEYLSELCKSGGFIVGIVMFFLLSLLAMACDRGSCFCGCFWLLYGRVSG